jgi:hypothetical protein
MVKIKKCKKHVMHKVKALSGFIFAGANIMYSLITTQYIISAFMLEDYSTCFAPSLLKNSKGPSIPYDKSITIRSSSSSSSKSPND